MAARSHLSKPGDAALFAGRRAMVPGASPLPFVGAAGPGGGARARRSCSREVRIDRERLAAYDRVCGFPLRDRLPATYPHVLAFPLHLALMTDPSFPFPVGDCPVCDLCTPSC